jgi:hypothetical protein
MKFKVKFAHYSVEGIKAALEWSLEEPGFEATKPMAISLLERLPAAEPGQWPPRFEGKRSKQPLEVELERKEMRLILHTITTALNQNLHDDCDRELGILTVLQRVLLCDACEFELKHKTEKCPRPVPNLEVHTCGQEDCPMCGTYGVINASPVWGPYVTGGTTCPMCEGSTRVPEGTTAIYKKPCPAVAELPVNDSKTVVTVTDWRGEHCALRMMHEGKCEPKGMHVSEWDEREAAYARECVEKARQAFA